MSEHLIAHIVTYNALANFATSELIIMSHFDDDSMDLIVEKRPLGWATRATADRELASAGYRPVRSWWFEAKPGYFVVEVERLEQTAMVPTPVG